MLAPVLRPFRAGGVTFTNPTPVDQSFDAVLNYLKKQGKAIESADKQIGQIYTAQERSKKTATRIMVIFIKDNVPKLLFVLPSSRSSSIPSGNTGLNPLPTISSLSSSWMLLKLP